ncbi:tetratricopeptide repeat protein [candidate division KSB1 bacterium]
MDTKIVRDTYALFIIVILLSVCPPLSAQTAQEHFQQGMTLKEQKKNDEAIEAFKKAVEQDRFYTEALYEMGLIYYDKFTPGDLKNAEDAFDNAIDRCDDLNIPNSSEKVIRYRISYGKTLEEMKKITKAKEQWEKILDHQPENYDALTGMAKYHGERVRQFRIRMRDNNQGDDLNLSLYNALMSGNIVDDRSYYIKTIRNNRLMNEMPPIRWDQFVELDFDNAVMFNNRILDIFPDNRDAIYRKGLLYFDKVIFKYWDETTALTNTYVQDPEGIVELARIFEDLISRHPDDKDGHLFLGLAYHRLKEYEKASEEFEAAKEIMDELELSVFNIVDFLEDGGFYFNYVQSHPEISDYWLKKDPLYLTEYNERELEHYSRIAEANLRFSIPVKRIEGWQTFQGRILIKYGHPKYMKKNVTNDITSRFEDLSPSFSMDYIENEVWSYDNFSFIFENSLGDKYGNFTFPPHMNEIMREVIEPNFPEYYEYKPKGMFIDFPYDFTTFRGEGGKTLVEMSYGIPVNRIKFSEDDNNYTGVCRTGVFLHNSGWGSVIEDIQIHNIEVGISEIDTSSDELITGALNYQIRPGDYFSSVEMQDIYSENVGFSKDTLEIEEYGYGELQISGILLTNDIRVIDETAPIERSNLELTINPRRLFFEEEPIFIYYEIYNLYVEGTPGISNFTVEYSIQFAGEKNYSFGDRLKSLFGGGPVYKDVSTTFTSTGTGQEELLFLRIDHDLNKSGPYVLTLKITDNISGSTAEKPVMFRLF